MRTILLAMLLVPCVVFGQTTLEKAKTLYENRKYEEVKTLLKGIEEDNKDFADAQYYLGRTAFDQKEYDEATDYFDEAIETKDNVADYYNWLGNTYGTIAQDANPIRQGMLAPKMKNAWEKAIELDAKNVEARASLIQYYTQAPGFMGGSFDKAKEVARQIIVLNPARGHREMGNVLVREKNFVEAEKEYLEMVRIDPSTTAGLATYYMNQKQFDKAFSLFEEAVKKNPQDMGSMYQIGKTSALSGQKLDRGEECLKKYLTYSPKQSEPSHAGANMRLAQIYEKRGKKDEAKKLYETALKLDDNLKEAKEGLQRTSK